MNKRHLIMGLGLLVAAWFAFFADKTPVAEPEKRVTSAELAAPPASGEPAARARDAEPVTPAVAILRLRERAPYVPVKGSAQRNYALFGVTGWEPPPPKAKAGPAPRPTAPPLPYVYLGKKFEAGHWEVYLALGEDARVVRPRTLLDEKYRVDTISPPTLSLTYLPLMQVQTLNIGSLE